MPTFDFRCGSCSHVWEWTRPFGRKTSPPCPSCGSKKTEKLLSPPSVQFRGAGFYKTDHGMKQPLPTAETHELKKDQKKESSGNDGGSKAPAAESKKPV